LNRGRSIRELWLEPIHYTCTGGCPNRLAEATHQIEIMRRPRGIVRRLRDVVTACVIADRRQEIQAVASRHGETDAVQCILSVESFGA
jgi:hypothetical protein